MAPQQSAGILLYRQRDGAVQVLLAHPGGPFFARKDEGAWSIPKGMIEPGEEPLAAARREFEEETGVSVEGDVVPLGTVTQRSGKIVHAWASEGDCDTERPPPSNTFRLEWPPRSGREQEFPEIDRMDFFDLPAARLKINAAQRDLLDRLQALLQSKSSRTSNTPP